MHNAGIQPLLDDTHAIAHAKVMVIDATIILTGSFHFTTAAEEKHAEHLLVISDAPELVPAYEAHIRLHASHAHLDLRQAALGWRGTSTTVSGKREIRGNKHSKIYRLPRCPGYDAMSPANIIAVASETAAQQAGYRKAKNCR